MPRFHNIQYNFNAGELSPLLEGRVDLAHYFNTARKVENYIPLVQGGVTRSPGTKYVNQVYNNSADTRLIPFIPSPSDAYMLLFADGYILIYKDGAPVESGGSQVKVVSPYTASDLPGIKYAQKNDILYLVHKNHPQRRLERSSDTDWALNTIRFDPPPIYEGATDLNSAITPGATTGINVIFTAAVSNLFKGADAGRIISYKTSRASIAALLDPDKTVLSLIRTVNTATAEVNLHGYSTGDIVYIHGADQSEYNGAFSITLDGADPNNKFTYAVEGAPASPATGTIKAAKKITTQSDRVAVDILDDFPDTNQIATGQWHLLGSPNTKITPDVVSPIGAIVTFTADDNAFRGSDVGKYLKLPKSNGEAGGLVKITSFTNTKTVKGEILNILEEDQKTAGILGGIWTLEIPSWSNTNKYPGSVTFHENRLAFAGNIQSPYLIWGSETGGYENFAVGANDDNSFEHGSPELSQIQWLAGTKVLMVGTSTGEWELKGGGDNPITPSSIITRLHSTHGSSSLQPVRANGMLLFVQKTKKKLFEIGYDFASDSYLASDLTIFAEHITGDGIVDMAYQQEPNSVVWLVRSDGVLAGLTYMPEHKVVGWFCRTTSGEIKNVAVIPHPDGDRDQVWLVVKRVIGGADKYYVETMEDKAAYYKKLMTDCAVIYDGNPTTTVTGLDHLEGETVDILADGYVLPEGTVTNGQITIPIAASKIEVGLHYDSILETVRPEVQIEGGTSQGKRKRWNGLVLRVHESLNLVVNDDRIELRKPTYQMDKAIPTYTGDLRLSNAGWDYDGTVKITQDKPLPSTILCLFGTLSFGD